ncbi:MAG: hypothetical protein IMW96_03920 [Thermoanaerobacteraceae bacterium]|nr:hypothetical protein [Thermoanaerobacteraceae bacterium]
MGFIRKLVKLLRDQRGSAFIENGLWIIVVVLLVAGAGYTLASQGVKPKFRSYPECHFFGSGPQYRSVKA